MTGVTIHASEAEVTALCELLDMAVRANGLSAAERAGFWVQKLQASVDATKAVPSTPENPNVVPFEGGLNGAA